MKKAWRFAQHFPGLLTVSCGSHCQYQDSPLAQPVQRLGFCGCVARLAGGPWNFGEGIG